MGLTLRTKLSMPAVALMMPPSRCMAMTWDSSNPSRNCSAYEGFCGALSRAADTAVRAVCAAEFR